MKSAQEIHLIIRKLFIAKQTLSDLELYQRNHTSIFSRDLRCGNAL